MEILIDFNHLEDIILALTMGTFIRPSLLLYVYVLPLATSPVEYKSAFLHEEGLYGASP